MGQREECNLFPDSIQPNKDPVELNHVDQVKQFHIR